jgi:hypothetical protein
MVRSFRAEKWTQEDEGLENGRMRKNEKVLSLLWATSVFHAKMVSIRIHIADIYQRSVVTRNRNKKAAYRKA